MATLCTTRFPPRLRATTCSLLLFRVTTCFTTGSLLVQYCSLLDYFSLCGEDSTVLHVGRCKVALGCRTLGGARQIPETPGTRRGFLPATEHLENPPVGSFWSNFPSETPTASCFWGMRCFYAETRASPGGACLQSIVPFCVGPLHKSLFHPESPFCKPPRIAKTWFRRCGFSSLGPAFQRARVPESPPFVIAAMFVFALSSDKTVACVAQPGQQAGMKLHVESSSRA